MRDVRRRGEGRREEGEGDRGWRKGERRKRREGREEGEIDGRKKKVDGRGERPPSHPIMSSVEIYKRNGTVKSSVFIVTELHNVVSRNCK